MNTGREFRPSRLTLARKRRGLRKLELANKTGVTGKSIIEYEKGTQTPRQDTVQVLADVLEFPVGFFYGSDIEPPEPETVSFRSYKKMTAGTRNRALAAAGLGLALASWLDEKFDLPTPNLPEMPELRLSTPDDAAQMLRQIWSIGERPVNIVHLLESKGVRVFSLAENAPYMDAFSFWRAGTPFVFLNAMKSAERSRFDASHELGHLILHRHVLDTRHVDAEKQADQFASAFLMPKASMLCIRPQDCTLPNLIKLKNRWQVSLAALVFRLHQVGTIREWHYRNLCLEMSKKGYFRSEPNPGQREMSQLIQKAFAKLRQDGVSKAQVAAELEIPDEELDTLIFGLTLVQVKRDQGALSPTKRRSPILTLVK